MQALSRSFFNDPNNGLFIQFMFHRTLSTTWRQLFAAYQFFKISQLDTLWMHTVSNLSANSCTAAIMPCAWGILVDGLLICPGYIPRNLSANFLHKLYKSPYVPIPLSSLPGSGEQRDWRLQTMIGRVSFCPGSSDQLPTHTDVDLWRP